MNFADSLQAKAAPYIRMMRLKQQTIGTLVYLFGALDAQNFNLTPLLIAFTGLVALSVAGFMINDYFDAADTDKFSYRKRMLQQDASGKVVLIIWLLLNILGFLLLASQGLIFTPILYFLVNTGYSAPPFRFKAHFPFDLLATIFQGLGAYSTPFLLLGLSPLAIISPAFITLGLFTSSGYFLLGIMDTEADTAAKLKNIGPALGYKWLIRITKVLLISTSVGIGYLFFTRSYRWYYPLAIGVPYFGYALGRLREAVYLPKNLKHSTLNISFTRAVSAMGIITAYLLIIFIYGTLKYNGFLDLLRW